MHVEFLEDAYPVIVNGAVGYKQHFGNLWRRVPVHNEQEDFHFSFRNPVFFFFFFVVAHGWNDEVVHSPNMLSFDSLCQSPSSVIRIWRLHGREEGKAISCHAGIIEKSPEVVMQAGKTISKEADPFLRLFQWFFRIEGKWLPLILRHDVSCFLIHCRQNSGLCRNHLHRRGLMRKEIFRPG